MSSRRQLLRIAKWIFRITILLAVTWGIARAVQQSLADLQHQQQTLQRDLDELTLKIDDLTETGQGRGEILESLLRQREDLLSQQFTWYHVSPSWLVLAGLFYVVGFIPNWYFWHQTLRAMGQRPRMRESLRAFYIGHLGKYVPGKAMVVLLRAGGLRSCRVDTTMAATSVFVETLTMIAVGAFLSAGILIFISSSWELWGLAVLLMLVSGIPTVPPIFRRIVRGLQIRRFNTDIDQALKGLNYGLMLRGWLLMSGGWVLLGLSLWATMYAIPSAQPQIPPLTVALPILTAAVGLAVVAGFVSLLPGGVGVRDYLVMALLAPVYGSIVAVTAAILLRLVWLLAELVAAGLLAILIRPPADLPDAAGRDTASAVPPEIPDSSPSLPLPSEKKPAR